MLFADWLNDLLGQSCLMFFGLIFLVGWGIKARFSSSAVQEGAKLGFWWWLMGDDD